MASTAPPEPGTTAPLVGASDPARSGASHETAPPDDRTAPTQTPSGSQIDPEAAASAAPTASTPTPWQQRQLPPEEPSTTLTASWELASVIQAQIAESSAWSTGAEVAVSVHVDGRTVAMTSEHETSTVASASTAKMYWVVAAVDAVGIEPVAGMAEAVFAYSDNDAAGRVIDLVGIDAINAFTGAIAMDDTYLAGWSFGTTRVASDRAERGDINTTSAVDATRFLDLLVRGELLSPAETEMVLAWMRLAPDTADSTPYGATLVADLDPAIATSVAHKAGWLPPGCCTSFANVLLAAGAVPLDDGNWYTIAITTANGGDFDGQGAWISATAEAIDQAIRVRAGG